MRGETSGTCRRLPTFVDLQDAAMFIRYLFVRGLHDREGVLKARLTVLEYILQGGQGKLDLTKHWEEGVLDLRCGGGCLPYMEVRLYSLLGALAA